MLVAGTAAVTAVIYDQRDLETIKKDNQIYYGLKSKIANAPQFSESDVKIQSIDQNVLLFGHVQHKPLIKELTALAHTVPDVKKVHNKTTVGPKLTLQQVTGDTWITTKIKTRMLAEPALRSMQISVSTYNQKVYLVGMLPKKQSDIATQIARSTSGVQKVIRLVIPVD